MLARMEISKVLVPIVGNGVDGEVVRLACELAEENDASVYAVYVIEVERSLPLDVTQEQKTAMAEEILSRAEQRALEDGYHIDTGIIQAREAGPALVHEAREGRADLIVLGVGYKKRLGVFNIGDTTSYVLKEAPCGVVLYRAAAPDEAGQ
jgi:nucleotide-binding universal stress UspA family protein